MPPERPRHDPRVCGLFDELCPGCCAEPPKPVVGNAYDQARLEWERLLAEHHGVLRGEGARSWEPPEPLDNDAVRRLVATVLHPRVRPLLHEVLKDLITSQGPEGGVS